MTAYYVATLARYVLVDAEDEARARELGPAALRALYDDVCARLGKDVPINILTVRPATADEIEFAHWHHEAVAREAAMSR